MMRVLGIVVVLAIGACASADETTTKPRRAHEVVSGAGRIRGGGMRMDVSIGHSLVQRPVKGNNQVVKQGVVTP
jgi:hypothetical protein